MGITILTMIENGYNPCGGEVLGFSSDRDDQRICLGFEIFGSGIFLGKCFFGWLDLNRDCFGY